MLNVSTRHARFRASPARNPWFQLNLALSQAHPEPPSPPRKCPAVHRKRYVLQSATDKEQRLSPGQQKGDITAVSRIAWCGFAIQQELRRELFSGSSKASTINVFIDIPPHSAPTSKSPLPPISPIHQIAKSPCRNQLAGEFANPSGKVLKRSHVTRRSRRARTRAPAPIPKFGLTQDDLKLHFPGLRSDPPICRSPAQLSFDELLDWANSRNPNPLMARLSKSSRKCSEVTARRGAND